MSARAEVLQAISRPVEASLQTLLRPVRFFRDYNPDDFPADLVAGITTGIILIPQSIAYALIAGLPPEVGLYTAIVAPIAAALWGSSNHLHTGPTNAESLLVLMIVSSVATSSDPIEFLLIAGLLTVLIGVMRLALGLLRAGFIINFISDAVMVGFTAGAGLLIITFQLSGLLGLDVERTFTFIDAARTLGQTWEGLHFVSLALGLGTVILIFALPQLHPRLPSLFLSVFLMSVLVASFGLAHRGVSVIAPVPAVLPPVANLPLTDFQLVAKLIPGALAIALIGLIEALTIARSIASQTGQHLDNNQEIVGQGVANILVGFLSGYCASGSFTRSRVNLNAGGKTPMTTLLSGVFVLVAVLTLGWAIRYLAKPVLAGFVIATAITLINLPHALQILRTSKSETFIMLVTWGSVFVFSLVEAVAIGITASLLVYVYKTSRPRVIPLVPDAKFKHLRERNPNKDPVCPQLDIIAIEGDLYFGAANHVEYLLRNRLADAGRQYHVLLNLQNMVRVDISGVHMLENYVNEIRGQGGDVYFFKMTDIARRLFTSSGFMDLVGPDHFLHDENAIDYLFHRVLNPKVCIYDCPLRVFRECQNLPKISIPFQDKVQGMTSLPYVPLIHVQELENRCTRRPLDFELIDVREEMEWDRGHIQVARHMAYSTFNVENLDVTPDREVVVISRSTRRSRIIAYVLMESGFSNVKVVEGGMSAWIDASFMTAISVYT